MVRPEDIGIDGQAALFGRNDKPIAIAGVVAGAKEQRVPIDTARITRGG